MLSMQGVRVQSLDGELRSHMPHCVAKNNIKSLKKKEWILEPGCLVSDPGFN